MNLINIMFNYFFKKIFLNDTLKNYLIKFFNISFKVFLLTNLIRIYFLKINMGIP